ncbi:MAG: HAD-IA family hydrolase [Phycisphaerales bacterium]|nr:HAD-IA family hydrolase [Planctomycetota bacterium]MCH8508430.1 HAD-IA family hydrolase [Phycisphaerales bacterium]
MSDGVRVVCFDWGGVILRICRSWAEGCEMAGLPVRGKSGQKKCIEARRRLSQRYQTGQMSDAAYFKAVAEASDGKYEPDEIEKIHHAWLIEDFNGTDELVHEINEMPKVSTALLSNTNGLHWMRRETDFTTASLIEHQWASHLFGLAKPDEKIYSAFERRVSASGSQILFFDDLEDNIKAARAMGWLAERIDPEKDPVKQLRKHLKKHRVL